MHSHDTPVARDIGDMSRLCRVVSRPLHPQSARDIRDIPLIGCRGVVSRGATRLIVVRVFHHPLKRVPLGNRADAGSAERILSTDLRILNQPSPDDTVSTKTRKPCK